MDEVISRECKFVFHLPAINDVRVDTHVIKELLTYSDGRTEPNLRILENFKRPFWITKEHYQNHTRKKESESIERLNQYHSTDSDLARNIAMRLGPRFIGKTSMRDIRKSPYVYGVDIEGKTIIKKMYQDKYPDAVTRYTDAKLDIETDTITDTVIVTSIHMIGKSFVVILKDAVKDIPNKESQLEYLFDKYIPKTPLTENIKKEFKFVDTEIELVTEVIKKAHEWKPDFISVWNIDYDMTKMLEVCKKFDVDPKDIFSDPSLPVELREFEYVRGNSQKRTASGKVSPINKEEQWHIVRCPATFYWIDAMSSHRYIRVGGKTVPGGYSLDNILEYELGDKLKKLKFKTLENVNLVGIEWHRYMVANRMLEYIIYNMWDGISMIQLDEKTKDLGYSLPMLAGYSSFDIFNSGPKRIVDALHYFYLERGKVLGTKAVLKDDKEDLGLKNWIVLLPSERIKENGLKVIEECGEICTNARGHTYDADQVSGYPSDTQAANVSKETTINEIVDIEGIDKDVYMLQNINLLFGKVNATEYANTMFNTPSLSELYRIMNIA